MKLNTNNNWYTIIYATVMVVVVAVLLAVVSGALKSRQQANIKLDTQKQILASLNQRDVKDAAQYYDEHVTEQECPKCHLKWYEANIDGQKKYVIYMKGVGLWGAIWGYIALDDDKNTIFGTYFSHESETPGLGAKIKEEPFQDEFRGHHILTPSGQAAIGVMKAGQKAEGMEQVDALSGATITSKGVETMIQTSLKPYVDAGWFKK